MTCRIVDVWLVGEQQLLQVLVPLLQALSLLVKDSFQDLCATKPLGNLFKEHYCVEQDESHEKALHVPNAGEFIKLQWSSLECVFNLKCIYCESEGSGNESNESP